MGLELDLFLLAHLFPNDIKLNVVAKCVFTASFFLFFIVTILLTAFMMIKLDKTKLMVSAEVQCGTEAP